jgi:flagellar FliL protein
VTQLSQAVLAWALQLSSRLYCAQRAEGLLSMAEPEAKPAAKPADPPTDAVAAPKTKSKLMLVVGLVVLLAGAGGGAFFFIRGKAKPSAAKLELPAKYIALDPPFVVNFENEGLVRFLQVTVQLMTRDPATAELLKQHDPRVRNDLLLTLSYQPYTAIASREGQQKLRASALEAVRRVIKSNNGEPAKLEALYFTSFVMQ